MPITCPQGQYLNNGTCTTCPAGYYCPVGTTPPGGANPPVICPPNTYCPVGTTPPGGSNPPFACPNGTTAPAGSTNVSQCVAPSGTLSIGAICYIALNANSCGMTITGTVANGINPFIYINGVVGMTTAPWTGTWTWGSEPTNGAINHTGWAPGAGTYTFTLADVNGNLASGIGVVSCTPGTVLDAGGYCRAPSLSSFSVGDCQIPAGGNGCTTLVSWSIANPVSPTVYFLGNWTPQWSPVPTGTNWGVNFCASFGSCGPGTYNVTVWDQVVLDTKSSTVTCAPGSRWDGSTCLVPSGTISVQDCYIPVGGTSCSFNLSWNIVGGTNPRVYFNSNPIWKWDGASYNDTVWSYWWFGNGEGDIMYTLATDERGNLDTKIQRTRCVAGSVWSGGVCAVPTSLLSSNKATVTIGELFEVTATGGGSAQSCRLSRNSNGGSYSPISNLGTSYTWGAGNGNSFSFNNPANIGYRLICYTNNDYTGVASTPYDIQVNVTGCPSGSAWNGSSCVACANGGCTNNACNNGAADAPICTHRSPTMGVLSCPAPGNALTINWTNPNGYTHSYVRINSGPVADWNGACNPVANPPNGVCTSVIPNTGTYTMASTPNQAYSGLIYASVDASGAFNGSPTAFNNVVCTPPAPSPSLTVSGTNIPAGSTSGTTDQNRIQATLTWPNIPFATSCSIDNGIGAVAVSGGSRPVTVNYAGGTRTYILSCSNATGGNTAQVTINHPLPPTIGSTVCPAPGTALTIAPNFPLPGNMPYYWAGTIESGGGYSWPQTVTARGSVPAGQSYTRGDAFSFLGTGDTSTQPTKTYSIWMHTESANGSYSEPVGRDVYCTPPTPTLSLTASGGTPAITSPTGANVVSHDTNVTLTWPAVLGATSCDIKTNGNQVVVANASVSGGTTTVRAGTNPFSSHSIRYMFTLSCTGTWGASTETASAGPLSFPPPPRSPANATPTTDEKVSISWLNASSTNPGFYPNYEIHLHNSVAGVFGSTVSITDVTGLAVSLPGVLTNSEYRARIRTKAGNGAFSDFLRTPYPPGIIGRSINLTADPSVITSIANPGSPINVGSPARFESLIRNTGSVTAGSFSNFFQVASGPNGGGVIDNRPSVPMNLLTSSATTTIDYTFLSSGTYSVRACADFTSPGAGDTVLENNEGNNCSDPWTNVVVSSPPGVSISPVDPINMRVGELVEFTSNASDVEGDLTEHNFDWRDPSGVWNYDGTGVAGIALIGNVSGFEGAWLTPHANSRNTNEYKRSFVPLQIGTYLVQSAARDSLNVYTITPPVIINVSCAPGEWFSVALNSCQKPLVSITPSCNNGAIASSQGNTCDICPIASVYINGSCVAGGACVGNAQSLITTSCGNSIVESGEECDGGPQQLGILGLSDPSKQKCTRSCTITCKTNTSDGSPYCGAGVGKVYLSQVNPNSPNNPGSQVVRACTNGALQSSAPTCSTCAVGEVFSNGICKAVICGDGIKNNGEQCDGVSGVTPGNICTSSCCLAPLPAALPPNATLSTYKMTCSGANRYKITRNNAIVTIGAITYTGVYTVPIDFTPDTPDTYVYTCFASTDPNIKDETTRSANLPPAVPPVVQSRMLLNASQKSIAKNGSVSVSWITPAPDTSCKVMVGPVITSATRDCDTSCIAERRREATRLTSELYFGTTDTNDGNRSMITALTTTNGASPNASGKKTVQMKYSNILYGACSPNPLVDPGATKMRIKVIGDVEG